MISLIVATDKNLGIGYNNSLPWRNPEELQFFKKMTIGSNIVMGSNTFKSLGRLLPERQHYVLTSNPNPQFDFVKDSDIDSRVMYFKDIGELLEFSNNFIVIGGSQVYNTFLKSGLVDKMIKSTISGNFMVDTYFPDVDKDPGIYGIWEYTRTLFISSSFIAREYYRR